MLKKRVGYGGDCSVAYLYKAGILVTLTLPTENIGSLISESAVVAAVNEEFQAFRMPSPAAVIVSASFLRSFV